MKKTYLITLFLSYFLSAYMYANDKITFTWERNYSMACIYITAEDNSDSGSLTIDWGDGSPIETKMAEGYKSYCHTYQQSGIYNVSVDADANCKLTYLRLSSCGLTALYVSQAPELAGLDCSSNSIAILNLANNTKLTYLNCSNNAIELLDVSANTQLTTLECGSNKLRSLDISANTELSRVTCAWNALSLQNLFAISEQITHFIGKELGTQNLPPLKLELNTPTPVITTLGIGSKQKETQFAVSKQGGTAAEGIDYAIGTEDIRFKTDGVYTVEMTNEAITTSGQPAKVIGSYVAGSVATQTISYTVNNSYHSFSMVASNGKTFTVDWGNNITEQYTGTGRLELLDCANNSNTDPFEVTITADDVDCLFTHFNISAQNVLTLDVSKASSLGYLTCPNNHISALDLSSNTELKELSCNGNQLSTLNLTNNALLTTLHCSGNRLTSLDISATSIYSISCYNNALPLTDLFAISNKVMNVSSKQLGTQQLTMEEIELNTAKTLNVPAGTDVVVSKIGDNAVEGEDYTLIGTVLTFKTDGIYSVEMTNSNVSSHSLYPAKVLQSFIAGTVNPQKIEFTWMMVHSNKYFHLNASLGASYTVDWGDGNTQDFIGTGSSEYIPHNYDNHAQDMTVSITATTAECMFTELNISNNQLSMLDVSRAISLTKLNCFGRGLTVLDLSNNTELVELHCYDQSLTELDLSSNLKLEVLDCHGNALTRLDLNANSALTNIYCYDNALPLSALLAISQQVTNIYFKQLGTQNLGSTNIALNTAVDLALPSGSSVAISKTGIPAIEDEDYTLSDNEITFLKDGLYNVEMTHSSIQSSNDYPARVVAVYFAGTVAKQKIEFTWENASVYSPQYIMIEASQGKAFSINWGDGSAEQQFIGEGSNDMYISHFYGDYQSYTVSISADMLDCFFTLLSMANNSVSTLDISQAPMLSVLDCSENDLIALDVSNNKMLTLLRCNDNKMSLTALYDISEQIDDMSAKYLGTQSLDIVSATTGSSLPVTTTLGGESTSFDIQKDFMQADASDYTIGEGSITFHSEGLYEVVMTNAAIESSIYSQAEVTIQYRISQATGTKDIYKNSAYVYSDRNNIFIKNSDALTTIYDLTGMLIYQGFDRKITVDKAGLYIVNVNGKREKVMVY